MRVWKGTQFSFNWLRLISNLPDSKASVGAFLHWYFLFSWLIIDWVKSVLKSQAIIGRLTWSECFTVVYVFGEYEIQSKILPGMSDFNIIAFVWFRTYKFLFLLYLVIYCSILNLLYENDVRRLMQPVVLPAQEQANKIKGKLGRFTWLLVKSVGCYPSLPFLWLQFFNRSYKGLYTTIKLRLSALLQKADFLRVSAYKSFLSVYGLYIY